MNTAWIRDWMKMVERKREAEERIAEINEQIKECERLILRDLQEEGVDRITVDGKTVYVRREVWASSGGDTPALVQAFKEEGLDELVTETVSSQRLSAWVREHDPERSMSEEEIVSALPPRIAPHVKVTEVFKLGYRSR